uniref:Reverse transcriptase n=1 Tax=Solanum tuberosum TaxID=4113 RepID=M1D9C3_SOLTU
MSLPDLYLMEALKIHVQILETPQYRDTIQATLQYQLAWRVQNHEIDLSPQGGQDTLFVNVDATNGTTQCTQIPRQISREELVKVLPDSWVINYEKLRDHPQPLQSTEPTFSKKIIS